MTVPFGKVPSWVGQENCPLHGAVEYGLIAILAARRAVRRKRFFYKGAEVILEPGHVCVSQRDLAEKLAVDRQRIRTGIKNLQKLQILNPPTNPPTNPKNGPAPQVFFFNVDMQLDAFGVLMQPKGKPINKPAIQPPANPVETQQKPTSIDVKMIRGLEGTNAPARDGDLGKQDPPPDPKNFVMTESWSMDRETDDRLQAANLERLGPDAFWRQVQRFVGHHRELGTVDDQEGFERKLEGWLERADDNRENPPPVNGRADGKNGHKTKPVNGFKVQDFEEFARRSIALYRREMVSQGGTNGLTRMQEIRLKSAALNVAGGGDKPFGLDDGPQWSADELIAKVQRLDRSSAK